MTLLCWSNTLRIERKMYSLFNVMYSSVWKLLKIVSLWRKRARVQKTCAHLSVHTLTEGVRFMILAWNSNETFLFHFRTLWQCRLKVVFWCFHSLEHTANRCCILQAFWIMNTSSENIQYLLSTSSPKKLFIKA